MGGEEKCGKERVKSWGNSSCCPSTLLLLQVNYEFLLFGFPDAHSPASVSKTSMFLSGGLSSIPVWIEGIEGIETKTFTCVYLFEDGLSVFKITCARNGEVREKDREKRSFRTDHRGYFVQGNCSVLLL